MITNVLHLVRAASEPELKLNNSQPGVVLDYLQSRIRGRLDDAVLYVNDFLTISVTPPEHARDGCDVYIRLFNYAIWGVLDWNEEKLKDLVHVIHTVNRIVVAAAQAAGDVENFKARIGMEVLELQKRRENQLYQIRGFRYVPYHKFWNETNTRTNQWFQKVLTKLQQRPATAAAEPAPTVTWTGVLDLIRKRPNRQYSVRLYGVNIAVRAFQSSPTIFVEADLHPTSKYTDTCG